MTIYGTSRGFWQELEEAEKGFLIVAGMFVFAAGYQLGQYLNSGESDPLVLLLVGAITLATYAQLRSNETDDSS